MKILKEVITIKVYSDGSTDYFSEQATCKLVDIKEIDSKFNQNISQRVRQLLLVILDMEKRYKKDQRCNILPDDKFQKKIYFDESFKKSIKKISNYLGVKEQTVIDKFARQLEYTLDCTIRTISAYITDTEKDCEFIKNGADLNLLRLLNRKAPAQGHEAADSHEINKYIREV